MRRLCLFWGLSLLLALVPVTAQDGLNLPTELYVLLNEGAVERYGLGTAGIQRVTPEDQFVLDFRVAPDGNWIAYRTQDGLYMQNMFISDTRRPIDADNAGVPPIRGRGATIAWAQDGSAIAYTTESGVRVHLFDSGQFFDIAATDIQHLRWSPQGNYLALQNNADSWWVYRRSSSAMTLALPLADARDLIWFDAETVLFAPLAGGLETIDLANGNQRTPRASATDDYYAPYRMADGSVRVFVGDDPAAATLHEAIITNTDTTVTEIGTRAIDTRTVRWAPRGNLMIAFRGGALALLDPFNGGGFTLPITTTAAYSWGPQYPPVAAGLQLPTDGYFIATDNTGVEQVWRLPADGTTPTPITQSETPISEYAFAPDSNRLAIVTRQTLAVLTLDSDDAPRELTRITGDNRLHPAWSPDGQYIYYTNRTRIDRVTVATGATETFVQPVADSLQYVRARPARGISAVAVTLQYAAGDRGFAIYNAETADRLIEYLIAPAVLSDSATLPANTYFNYGDPLWLSTTDLLFAGTLLSVEGIDPRPQLPAEPLPALHRVDVNQLENAPSVLFPLFFGTITAYTPANDQARLLVKRRDVAQHLLFDVPLVGGAPQAVGNAGYMVNPVPSPDGQVIVGQTAPDGALLIYNQITGDRALLDTFPQTRAFQWR